MLICLKQKEVSSMREDDFIIYFIESDEEIRNLVEKILIESQQHFEFEDQH